MILYSVLYPATDGATFDHDYYRDTHVPLCLRTWGLDAAEIERGIDGPFVAAVHFRFESLDAMHDALASPGTADVRADIVNYTSIVPIRQTSEIA